MAGSLAATINGQPVDITLEHPAAGEMRPLVRLSFTSVVSAARCVRPLRQVAGWAGGLSRFYSPRFELRVGKLPAIRVPDWAAMQRHSE